MNPTIKSILAGSGTGLSSKRVVMFLLLFMFLATCIVNLVGGLKLDPTLRDQLYYSMLTMFGLVFGENAISTIKGAEKKAGVTDMGLPDEKTAA